MKPFRFAGLIFVLALCVQCQSNKDQPLASYHWDDKTQLIVTSAVPCDSSVLLTGGMEMMDGCCLMYNIRQSDLFSFYRLRNDSLIFISQLQKRGRGPYEALAGRAVFMPECNSLYLIDQQTRQKAFRIDLNTVTGLSDVNTWETLVLPANQNLMSIIPVDCEGNFTAQILDDREHMFGIFKAGDSTVAKLEIPYPETDVSCPDISLGTASLGTIRKRPGEQEYVFSAQNSRYVMLFTVKNGKADNLRLLYDTPAQFTLASDGINIRMSGESPSGFYVHATKRYIYLTPRNHRKADKETLDHSPAFGSAYETFVFDWDGKPVKKILADKPLKSVTVTGDDLFLYAKYADPETLEESIVRGSLR